MCFMEGPYAEFRIYKCGLRLIQIWALTLFIFHFLLFNDAFLCMGVAMDSDAEKVSRKKTEKNAF